MKRKEKMKRRIDLAMGRFPVELVLKNCKIINVFNHQIEEGDIAIDGGKIIGIGSYEGKEIIDLEGKYVAPGLIDSHVHIESSLVTPSRLAQVIMPRGTTTIIADPHEIANVKGKVGIDFLLQESKKSPLSIFFMMPSCVPATDFENSGAKLSAKDLSPYFSKDQVLGLGEVMDYPGVMMGKEELLEKMVLSERKIIDGHGPVIKGKELNAYMINGIKTDHECSSVEEMKERIGKGMYIAIREGSAARDLSTLLQGVTESTVRRCTFCTDDKNAEDILHEGHIDHHVRVAIKNGIHPISAIQMASLNTAECYQLRDMGAIAPGYDADLIVFSSFDDFLVEQVFKKGKLVAKDGRALFQVQPAEDKYVINTVNLPKLTIEDLKITLESDIVNVIRVIADSLITERVVRKVTLDEEGAFTSHELLDILKAAVIERHRASGSIGLGLVEGFNLRGGAIATTIAHDSHNLIVIGDQDQAILRAIREIEEMQGGIVIVKGEQVAASLALPIAGIMTDEEMEEVSRKMLELKEAAKDLGVTHKDPFMTLSFMALPVIPAIKLTDQGLFDVKEFSFIGLEKQKDPVR